MARVKTFKIDDIWGVPDSSISEFITDCEKAHYVNVTMLFVSYLPQTPENKQQVVENRITVVVTKLDIKDQLDAERDLIEASTASPSSNGGERLVRRKPLDVRQRQQPRS